MREEEKTAEARGRVESVRILKECIDVARSDIAFDTNVGNHVDECQYGVSLPYKTAQEIADFLQIQVGREHKQGIYIASKTKHADRWRFLRDKVGEPIISTWIDEADDYATLDWEDLWQRCTDESSSAQVLIIYREPAEELKGAWVEMGAALASGVPVFAIGIEEFNVAKDGRIRHFASMKEAIAAARELRAAPSSPPFKSK